MKNDVRFMGRGVYLYCTFALFTQINSNDDDVIAILQHGGRVRGSVMNSNEGRRFYAFRGIPYAEPPIGNLRFKPPIAKATWGDNIFDATKDGPVCVQTDLFKKVATGQEDCLRINVYTRKIPELSTTTGPNMAVMVFIHGGGFMFWDGTSSSFGPEFLMDSDVVFVSFNYRLDAFGFLSTGDEASPGNYGYLDQSLALQWVQDTIEVFGGDKNRVTIFGESAGGASVAHHVLSPVSKGLFHGAIMMSGTATCLWDISEDVSYWSKKLGEDVGCPTNGSQELVDCLQEIPAERIVDFTATYMIMSLFPIPFTPTVDGYFFPDHPLNLLRSSNDLNRVPVISGVTEMEGNFFIAHILSGYRNRSLTSDDFLTDIIGYWFGRYKPVPDVTDMIKRTYFNSVDFSNETQVEEALSQAITEGMFNTWHYETIRLLTEANFSTYTYSYDYNANYSFVQTLEITEPRGASHMDDLIMLFPMAADKLTKADKDMSKTVIKLWVNFANYGTPIPQTEDSLPKWPSVMNDTFPIYHINNPITLQEFDPQKDPKYHLWTTDVRNARTKADWERKPVAGIGSCVNPMYRIY